MNSPSQQLPFRAVSPSLTPFDVQSLRQEGLSVENGSVSVWVSPESSPGNDLLLSLVVGLSPQRIDSPKVERGVLVEGVGSVEEIEDNIGDGVNDAELYRRKGKGCVRNSSKGRSRRRGRKLELTLNSSSFE